MQTANVEAGMISMMPQKLVVGLHRNILIGLFVLMPLMDPAFAWFVNVRNLPTSSIRLRTRYLCGRECFRGRSTSTKFPMQIGTRLFYQAQQEQPGGGDAARNDGEIDYSSIVTTTLDPDNLPSIHQLLARKDPTWYEEFVIGPLGQEFVDSNYLSVMITQEQEEEKHLAPPISTAEEGSSSLPLDAIAASSGGTSTVGESTEATISDAASSESIAAVSKEISTIADLSKSSLDQPEDTTSTTSPLLSSIEVQSGEQTAEMSSTIKEISEDTTEQSAKPPPTTAMQDDLTFSSLLASSSLESSEEAPSEEYESNNVSKMGEPIESKSLATPAESVPDKKTQVKVEATSKGVDQTPSTREVGEEKVTKTRTEQSANQSLEDIVEKKTEVQADDEGDDTRVVMFGVDQQTIPISRLTKQLGYREEEIVLLQADVLSVIINDKIERPRLGLPAQWKVAGSGFGTSRQQPRQEVRIVNSIDGVLPRQPRQDEGKREGTERNHGSSSANDDVHETNPRTTDQSTVDERLPKIQRSGSRTTPPRRTSVRGRNGESAPLSSPISPTLGGQELDAGVRKRPRPSTETASARGPKGANGPRSMPPPDAPTRSNSSGRPSRRASKGPRKIYNVRGDLPDSDVMKQRRPPKRAKSSSGASTRRRMDDPPAPSTFWPDMTKFRDLMRREEELRLRILGDDWTPSVRQETEWRMGLYKDWLWTLHNGVGNDVIVPPSRYERARRLGDRIAEEENNRQRKAGGKKQEFRPKRRDEYRRDEDLPRQKVPSQPPNQRKGSRPPASPKRGRGGPPPPQSRGRR